ncbi:MAG TPA: transcription antitermination factor NusB [Actinomycetes bacterium]|nr:transcription antitermination factor NusB [Actinomycetes bacterium]
MSGNPGQPRRGRPRPDEPRLVAYALLRAVAVEDAYANLALPALLRERGLYGRDAAFATELAYGTLRGQGTYDAVLAACVDRPLAEVDVPVLVVLRLGVHQLLALRVPTHAAVSATVELARAVVGEGRARFVNAVLRRVAEHDQAEWLDLLSRDRDALDTLALRHAHPRWVVEEIARALGVDASDPELAAALAADDVRPPVTLVARPGRGAVEELLDVDGARAAGWSPYAVVLASGGDPALVPAVRAGRAAVQDEGSQLVAIAAAAVPLEGADRRWLDLCAGPGGKAALLAGLAGERGARLTANEVQPHRAELVRRAVAGRAEVTVADGRAGPWDPASFDRVLVDAPCTGLGALRRRPEVRWRRRPEDVPALAALQRDLLAAAVDAVRPGGVVVYATCSPVLAETREVVADALRRGDVEELDVRPALRGVPDVGDGPDAQLWPHRHGTDAMYLAALRRR